VPFELEFNGPGFSSSLLTNYFLGKTRTIHFLFYFILFFYELKPELFSLLLLVMKQTKISFVESFSYKCTIFFYGIILASARRATIV
jgi:hypothetical protein